MKPRPDESVLPEQLVLSPTAERALLRVLEERAAGSCVRVTFLGFG